ncbi:MAG: hypothetical protein ACOYVE_09840 [Melioribacter sp.]|uniref:hypothetical protein n=2 Tax=Melioribacter TaxID=1134403 RepID=UPI003BE7DE86
MKKIKDMLIISFFITIFSSTLTGQSLIKDVIPKEWKIIKTVVVPKEKIASFNNKFGINALSITNDIIDTDAGKLQINIVICESDQDATILYNQLEKLHKSEKNILKVGNTVYEIITKSEMLIKKVKESVK